jgi:hypothetical protein
MRQFRTAYVVGWLAIVAIGVILLKRAPWILVSRLVVVAVALLLFAPIVIGLYFARLSDGRRDRRD